jgi:carboxypeptidase D
VEDLVETYILLQENNRQKHRIVQVTKALKTSLALIAVLLGSAGYAGDGSSDITAAGPRLGPVAIIEVTLPDRQALDELTRQGYNITNLTGNLATIYATPQELDRLTQAGYDYRQIGSQPAPPEVLPKSVTQYHDYSSVTSELQGYAGTYPAICNLYTLGQSVQGRELWALLITDDPNNEEDEPEFKYVAAMHGDESLGTEMCLYFIDLLLTEYGTDTRITNLIDSTAIWVVPLMNPDGLELGSRYNANGYDLNRSFPAYPTDFTGNIFDGEPLGDAGRQPEVAHIMNWTARNSFVLSANFHTGALVVNYPYDDDGKGSVDSPTPDDLLFEDISRRYSIHNSPMWSSPTFPDGITNGAAWYSISGGMQDWNYRYASCSDVTIEISNTTKPPAPQIPDFWADNNESMLSYLEAVHIGVRGLITDRTTGGPLWAQVLVEDNNHPVFTDPNVGDYHRMLLPGTYNLSFNAPLYVPRDANSVSVTSGPATILDIELSTIDINYDGGVDFEDFDLLAANWGQTACGICAGADLTYDGNVDMDDLRTFAGYWLAGIQ